MEGNLDHLSAMMPIDFFELNCSLLEADPASIAQVKNKRYRLPHFSSLLAEKPCAEIHMGWSVEGLLWHIEIKGSPEKTFFPEWEKGDAIELYIDTRALPSAAIHKFCHCFVILPQIEGDVNSHSSCHEVTPFRTDEGRPYCDPKYTLIETKVKRGSYEVDIEIMAEGLYGYQPLEVKKLKFAYQIHRYGKEKQHFALSSKTLHIGRHPQLWSLMNLN